MNASAAVLDKLTHTYTNGEGEKLDLSVTQVCELSGIRPPYPPEAEDAVEHAGELGEVTHEWCEFIDRTPEHYGDAIESLADSEPLPYVLAYQRFREKFQPKWEFIELGFHRDDCAGTPDRIGVIDKEIVIVDIKTPKRIAKHWQIQLSGYQWITGLKNSRLFVVYLSADGMFRLLPYEPDIPTWEAALKVARWKLSNGR